MEVSIWIFLLLSVLKVIVVTVILLTAVAYTVLLERKVVGRIQNRWGPSRVGPFGLLQPLADGLKLFLKEDLMPESVYRPLFVLAPIIALACALMSISMIPFGDDIRYKGVDLFQISDVNIGLLILLAITGVGVYGIALSGWASNNKYSLLGALRASAQVISYELALGLSLVGVILRSQSLRLRDIVDVQATHGLLSWNVFGGFQFVAFFIYLTAAYAETNRAPFDLPEAESELTAGYHTEYSSMKFAMFFMAEYANMITVSCVATLLFLGGWSSPFGNLLPAIGGPIVQALLPVFWFVAKVFFFLFLYVWVRGTLPRFRYDQLMSFGWKFLMPLAVLNIIATSLWLAFRAG
ncbi:NADH-quinone oxidoreductase subunit NuoH [Silvibacterium dinghuense]|uniref:NADH-quinone oxidoreductase subunit H n=1 Tax=Silvibacterium dinghuense TaxID=1560006 RepID=A0A4Q1SD68_9BACT|nr:NADH-quinone oxidoreductase subunit NuoH [Silvibacterium dinghuense]RXS95164.1 NADH-quinone oxidoreductase subunit NuoH [Silvibacterium dinghuense]